MGTTKPEPVPAPEATRPRDLTPRQWKSGAAAWLGTVLFGQLAPVGDHRLALLWAGFLFVPAAAVALLLPEPPAAREAP